MDPVAHTLVGAALAEAGLRRKSPLATATLLLGANAPDIDIVSAVAGADASLHFRRGHTHGVVAMLVLPVVLTALMLAFDRWIRRRRLPDAPPARGMVLLSFAAVSVWSHPALDWLNTYGVRLLMPFDGRWFYGDALFIIDPWLWLLMAAPVVLARSRGKLSLAAWVVLACGATALVTLTGLVPLTAKITWAVGVASIVILRQSSRVRARVPRLAAGCLLLLAAYIVAMIGGSELSCERATAWLASQGIAAEEIAATPEAANPFTRTLIARAGDEYHFVEHRWLGDPPLRLSQPSLPVGPRDPIVKAALAAPAVRGLAAWLRFPSVTVTESEEGYTVVIRDVRYGRRNAGGLGTAEVHLDHSLRPR